MDMAALRARTERYEGRRATMYLCPAGKPTVGVGFNLRRADARKKLASIGADLDAVMAGRPLTEPQIERLLDLCLEDAIAGASALVRRWPSLPVTVREVLVDLVFNMGSAKVAGFPAFLAAIEAGDWSKAADELVDSRWYRQVGRRSREIVAELRSVKEA